MVEEAAFPRIRFVGKNEWCPTSDLGGSHTYREDLKKGKNCWNEAVGEVCQPVRAEHTAKAPRHSSPSSVRRRKRDSQRAVTAQSAKSRQTYGIVMQPRDNKRARLLPSATLDTLDNDLLIRCASYLDGFLGIST